MKKLLFTNFLAVLVAAFSLIGCQPETEEAPFDFAVTDAQGAPVSSVQPFVFGQKLTFPFVAKGLRAVEATAPEGWDAKATVGAKSVTISAPDAKNASAALEGVVTVKATSTSGKTAEASIPVAVSDASIEFAVTSLPETLNALYGSLTEYDVVSSNVETVDVSAPKGWTVTASASKLSVKAPAKSDAEFDVSGTVTLTPKSARGNVGSPVSFGVAILLNAPTLTIDASSLVHLSFGSTKEIVATEAENIVSTDIDAPKGWTVSYDVSAKKLTVVTPSFEADSEGAGTVYITASSSTGETADVDFPVSLVGINNADDFMAFAEVANGGDLSPYSYNSEVILNSDIDLSNVNRNVFVTKFSGVFNGRGKSILYNISTDQGKCSLFDTVYVATLKNIKTTGSILTSGGTKTKIQMSSLAVTTLGACTFENISNYATLKQTGTNEDSWGSAGGLIAEVDETSVITMKNCHNYGAITCSSPKYFGGLIGLLCGGTSGIVEDCSNEADITFNFNGLDSGGMMAGGCFGVALETEFKFYRCFNKGNITYDLKERGVRCLGGFVGQGVGYYEDCYNTGNITNKECMNSVQQSTRRVGGFAGASWPGDGACHHSKNCYNTGNITEIGDYIGGFMGVSESSNHFENDYNSGNVTSISQADVSYRVGGFCGGIWETAVVENCTNRGNVICATKRAAAGFAVTADNAVFKNCKNEGVVKVGAVDGITARNYGPVIGGLFAICGTGSTVDIQKCSNTGAVTGMSAVEASVQSVYASEGGSSYALDPSSGDSDKNTCDTDTKSASSTASVTYIPKNQWSISTILSWLQ